MGQETTATLVYDNRLEPRKKALIHAFVSDRADITDLKCVIRDISKSGCRIATSYVEDLPRIIEIFPEGFDKPLTGKIIWRNSKVAGVQFLSAAEVAAYDREHAQQKPKVEPAGFFTRLQSFTSLRRRAGQLTRGERRSGKRMQDFGARVLHGLRNPLAALKGLLNLLLGDTIRPIPKRAKSVIRAAHQNAEKAESLVEEGLQVKNIESGQLPCNLQPVDIAELADNAMLISTGHAAKYDVRFELSNDAGKAMVKADAARMDDVMAYLLAHAAKASPAGETVTLALTRNDGLIRILVSDRGAGSIAAQCDTGEQHGAPGSSDVLEAGFDICRAILDKHGSSLHIDSQVGSGTAVWFELREID
ncbi:MAG: ATP-binding protein [Methyloligellaceae bacterium]